MMNELELFNFIKEAGIDISDCVISIKQTNKDMTVDEEVVLVTSAEGSIEHQFLKEQLFPDNVSGDLIYNTSNLEPQMSPENQRIYAELTPLALPETSVSYQWSSTLPPVSAQKKYHDEMVPSFEVPLKVGHTAKHFLTRNAERRKRKSSDDDYIYEAGAETHSESSSSSDEMLKGKRRIISKKFVKPGKNKKLVANVQPKLDKVLFSFPKKAHDFERGRFVIERENLYKTDKISIWKINDTNMLVKYTLDKSPIFTSTKKYRSFTKNRANEFVAIKVNKIDENTVSFENKVLPEVLAENLNGSPVVQMLRSYAYCLANQAIDNNFLSMITNQKVEYCLQPMIQVDSILEKAQELLASQTQWDPNFKNALDAFPCYTVAALVISSTQNLVCCQATNDPTIMATKCLSLYGPCYDYQTLRTVPNSSSNDEGKFLFYVSDSELTLAINYHFIRHYKYHLFQDSQKEVAMRQHSRKYIDTEIVNNIMDNMPRIRHFYGQLLNVLQSCGLGLDVENNP